MMKEKKSQDRIDEMLQNIEKVEAPIFLYTKIQARIKEQVEDLIPTKYIWATAFSLVFLLMFNVWAIQETTSVQTKDSITSMVEGMDLIPSNSFY